jgi:hypothetical protein
MSRHFPSSSLHLVHLCCKWLLLVVSFKSYVFIFHMPRPRWSNRASSFKRRNTTRRSVNAATTVSNHIFWSLRRDAPWEV